MCQISFVLQLTGQAFPQERSSTVLKAPTAAQVSGFHVASPRLARAATSWAWR
jgi:hypothetical protein